MSDSRRKSVTTAPLAGAFENIEFLIDGNGDITIGTVASIPCVASAADHDQCLAMLVRAQASPFWNCCSDSTPQSPAYDNEHFIDELNPALASKPKRRSKSRR